MVCECQALQAIISRSLRVAIGPVAADDVIVYILALFLLLSFFLY